MSRIEHRGKFLRIFSISCCFTVMDDTKRLLVWLSAYFSFPVLHMYRMRKLFLQLLYMQSWSRVCCHHFVSS